MTKARFDYLNGQGQDDHISEEERQEFMSILIGTSVPTEEEA